MHEERGLALRPEMGLAHQMSWQDMRDQASVLVKSGFLPKYIDTAEKCLAIMLTGRELGVPPMAAIRGMFVMDGKAIANAQLMLALVRRSGALEHFEPKDTPDSCTVVVKRRGEPAVTVTWTDEDTKRAGLQSGFAWQKYPRVMRRWRAITEALRLAFSDVLAGIYAPDELGVGYRVEGDDIVIDPSANPAPTPPADSARNIPREGYLKPSPPEGYVEPEPPPNGQAEPTDDQVKQQLGFATDDPERAHARADFEAWVSERQGKLETIKRLFKGEFEVEYDKATAEQYRAAIPWAEALFERARAVKGG